ncbi:MAG: nucleotidyltransferase domain-containing protein [Candidatus Parvarchaeota archaeon]
MPSPGYRSIMINEEEYNNLLIAKKNFSEIYGSQESFSTLIDWMLRHSILSLNLEKGLVDYLDKLNDILSKDDEVVGAVLFGSIAKGNYNNLSDVDVLIVVDCDTHEYSKRLWEIRKKLLPMETAFVASGKYYRFSPLVLSLEDLKSFRPIYLDIADYGVVLNEKGSSITKFLMSISKIKHTRKLTAAGVELKWKMKP